MKIHGVAASFLLPIMRTIVRKGLGWDSFCAMASIDASLIHQEDARIPEVEFERIVQAAAAFTGDDAFGLHQGQEMNLSDLGVPGYVMLHSKTLGKALEAYQKYNLIICSNFNVTWVGEGPDILIHLSLRDSETPPGRHCIEDMAASLYQIMLVLSGRLIPIKQVTFMHKGPLNVEPYSQVFGMIPDFCQAANTIRLDKEVLDYHVVRADSRLLGIFEAIAEEAKGRLTHGPLLTDQLSNWIIECMPSHFPTIGEAAKEMRMGVRTLQAKLTQERTSYSRLANEVRKELAQCYLAKPELTVAEIAYLLHFSEPSAFHTAFKKWTGRAPGEYRQQLQERRGMEDFVSWK